MHPLTQGENPCCDATLRGADRIVGTVLYPVKNNESIINYFQLFVTRRFSSVRHHSDTRKRRRGLGSPRYGPPRGGQKTYNFRGTGWTIFLPPPQGMCIVTDLTAASLDPVRDPAPQQNSPCNTKTCAISSASSKGSASCGASPARCRPTWK
ncbi:hypothetical protein CT19431_40438 [Cupriavidus taiwanensis]|nr:hypothetical protein CT19431_40438 [Cupriavidus taiwanensis]